MKIKAENIGKKIGRKYILQDINWEIDNENWVLFGSNGSGKTTLLSILAGYERLTDGKIWIDNVELTASNRALLREHIGFVSSSFFAKIFNHEAILDIILSGKTSSLEVDRNKISLQDVSLARDLLDVFGLGKFLRYGFHELSKGQQQCVLIARAFMCQPKVLILDEPCEGLDLLLREVFMKEIKYIMDSFDVNLIYVTHQTEEILPFFQKGILIYEGKIHSKGEKEKIFSSKNLSDFFSCKTECTWQNDHLFIKIPQKDWTEKEDILNKLYRE